MKFKINMGAYMSSIFAHVIKVKTSSTITQDYSNSNPFDFNISRTNYIELDLLASVQDYKTGEYNKTSDDIIIKNGIRINAEINSTNPILKHGDIIVYNTKEYMIKSVKDKSYSNHIVYLADLIK